VLSHTDRKPDPAYHREILSSGVKVEYDSAFRWKAGQGNPTRDLMVTLAGDGFLQQIMLGMDAARSSYWRAYGGSPGMDYLLTQFWPTLREAGLSGEDFETLFVRNPAEAYSFTEKQR
jgi:phosphotriesterase-related protein